MQIPAGTTSVIVLVVVVLVLEGLQSSNLLKGGARLETGLFYISERWRRTRSIEDEDDDEEEYD